MAHPLQRPRRPLAAATTAALLLLTACGSGGDGSDAAETVTVTADPTEEPTESETPPVETETAPTEPVDPETSAELPPGVTPEELATDLESAVQVTNDFWTTNWGEFFTGTYTPPTVAGLYDGNDPAAAPTCGGEPLGALNAFYCIPEDFVAWDQTLIGLGTEFGDAWPYLVVSHEWGHAVAARLETGLQAEASELQADCFAGATLYGARDDGTLLFEEGDERELVDGLNNLADETPWTSSADHGDPFQRVESFALGRNGGVGACVDLDQ